MFYSLTGRTHWWAFAGELVRDNPLVGLGGYAAGRFSVLGQLGATETSTLHSTWVELLVGVGLLGLIPFLITIAATWFNLLRPANGKPVPPLARELQVESIGIFVLLCCRSIVSDEFIWHPALAFFLVVLYAEVRRRGRLEGVPIEPSARGRDGPHGAIQPRLASWVRNASRWTPRDGPATRMRCQPPQLGHELGGLRISSAVASRCNRPRGPGCLHRYARRGLRRR
jgi:hypothetical protein